MATPLTVSSKKCKAEGRTLMVRPSASADPNSHSPSPTQEVQQVSEAVKNTASERCVPVWFFSEETQWLKGTRRQSRRTKCLKVSYPA